MLNEFIEYNGVVRKYDVLAKENNAMDVKKIDYFKFNPQDGDTIFKMSSLEKEDNKEN